MALSNTLFAGLSGLDVNQTKLNVVGNNIANSNTVAFKSTRVTFTPQFYVTDSGGSQPDGVNGGTNPSQRGLGAAIGGMERNLTAGAIEATGRPTDLALDGGGYFIVKSNDTKYTRDGTFKLNSQNKLVANSGDFVQGYSVDQNFNINRTVLTDLTIPLGALTTAQATSTASLDGNLKASQNVANGASVLSSQALASMTGVTPDATTLLTDVVDASNPGTPLFAAGDAFNLAARKGSRDVPTAAFTITAASTLGDLQTFFQDRLGINTTAPVAANQPMPGVSLLPDAINPGVAMLTITGNVGTENALSLPLGSFATAGGKSAFAFANGADAAGIANNPSGESVSTSFRVYDSLGTPINIDVTAVLESSANTGNTWRFYAESPDSTGVNPVIGSGTLVFDSRGRLQSTTGAAISIPRTGNGAVSPLNITLDFANMTSLTSQNSEMVMSQQDGSAIGRLQDFSIGKDGVITGGFSNGVTRSLGQVAIATFTNAQGLVDRGGNMFMEGASSGPAVVTTANTLGSGKIVSGALELSNVDLSEEFVNLIIASTGFSAASRVISTSNQMLTELLNSTR